jgi:hypothetical protein
MRQSLLQSTGSRVRLRAEQPRWARVDYRRDE